MAGRLVRSALRSSVNQVRYVTPVRPRRASGLTAEVYRQVERDFGMLAPPVALHSPSPPVLAAVWAMLRESLVATGPVSRATREAVATAVSLTNSCPYCVEVHTATMGGIEAGDSGPLTDWARASGSRAGAARHAWPFPVEHAPWLIAVAVAFHYLNRVVNVFLGDSPLPPRVPASARGTAGRLLGRFMRGPALRGGRPGDSVPLLAPAAPAADLAWAAGDRHIADAFARAAATVRAAGEASVPPAVRELVVAELAGWDGTPPGVSRAWTERPVQALSQADRPAGRLALLVAKSSYQVDDDVVAAYRGDRPADAELVELVSWAALAAAGTVGGWLAAREPTTRRPPDALRG